jgi:hypothetical protein
MDRARELSLERYGAITSVARSVRGELVDEQPPRFPSPARYN